MDDENKTTDLTTEEIDLDEDIEFRASIPGTLNISEPKSRSGTKMIEHSRENSESRKSFRRSSGDTSVSLDQNSARQHSHDSYAPLISQAAFSQKSSEDGEREEGEVRDDQDIDQKNQSEGFGRSYQGILLSGGYPKGKSEASHKNSEDAGQVSSPPLQASQSQVGRQKSQLSSIQTQSSENVGKTTKGYWARVKQSFHDPRDEFLFSYEAFNYAKRRLHVFFVLFAMGTFFCLLLDALITVWFNAELLLRLMSASTTQCDENDARCGVSMLDSWTISDSIKQQPLRILCIVLSFVMVVIYRFYPINTHGVKPRMTARSKIAKTLGIFEYHQLVMCLWFVVLGALLGANLGLSLNQIDGFTNALVVLIFLSSATQFCPLTVGYVFINATCTVIAGIVGTWFWLANYYDQLLKDVGEDAGDEQDSDEIQEIKDDIRTLLYKLFILVIAVFVVIFVGNLKSIWMFEKARRKAFASRQETERERVAKERAQSETNNLRGQVFQLTLKLGDLADFEEEKIDFETSFDKAVRHLRKVIKQEGLSQNGAESLQSVVKILTTAKLSGINSLYEPEFLKSVHPNMGRLTTESQLSLAEGSDLQKWLQDTLMEPDNFVTPRDTDVEDNKYSWQSWFGQFNPKATHPSASEIGSVPDDDEGVFKDLVQNHLDDWGFDIFRLRKLTQGRPLYSVGYALFHRYELVQKFNIDEKKLHNFLAAVEDGYLDNPYHNSMHGADVAHGCHYFLVNTQIHQFLSDQEKLAIVIASLIHDFEHPGFTNKFLIATEDVLSTRYNDKHVLENHHIASANLILQRPNCAILENLSVADKKEVRAIMIHCVLATDLATHFDHIGNFKRRVTLGDAFDVELREDRMNILTMALKCADLGHAAKPRHIHHRWTKLVMEEFYRQGDKERRLNMPISAFMDREKPSVAKSQTGFIDYLVKPLWECWVKWLDMESIYNTCYRTLLENHEEWKQKCLEETDPTFREEGSPTSNENNSPRSDEASGSPPRGIIHESHSKQLSPVIEEHKNMEPPSPVVVGPPEEESTQAPPARSPPREHKKNRVSFQDDVGKILDAQGEVEIDVKK